jgi:hypothetical protein
MLSLSSVARILVSHGINVSHPDTAADLAAFVAASCSSVGCSRRALLEWLGY